MDAEQLERRRLSIGSSDAAGVCGVSPYATPLDIWLEKTGRTEPFRGNEATDAGMDLEPAIVNMAARRLRPITIESDVPRAHDNGIMTATIDTVFGIGQRSVIVECKSAGIVSYLDESLWNEDEFPEWYMVQVQHQLACAPEIDHAYLAALTPPRGFRMYLVERDEELIEAITERCCAFWRKNIEADTPPDGLVSLDVAKRMRRQPNKIVALEESVVALFDEAKRIAKESAEREEQAKADLLYALGDAEQGESPIGVYTYFPNKNGVRTLRKKGGR